MEFRVLGGIGVAGADGLRAPPGTKERAILARLLIAPGRMVPAEALVEAAWEDSARDAALRSFAVRIANLRAFLEPGRARGAPSSLLVREGAGYRLAIAPGQVDAQVFEARVLAAAGRPAAESLAACDAALALWHGPPFGALADAAFAHAEARRLDELRGRAEVLRAEALVGLGRPLEALAVLERLVAAEPLREEPVAALMRALYVSGRQVEALGAYRDLAGRLRVLGLTPSEPVRQLELSILDHDPALTPAAVPATPTAAPAPAAPAPPGRDAELARLRAALEAARGGRRSGVLIGGDPGVGKSALVDALVVAARGSGQTGVGQCLAQRGPGEPYMPVLEALEDLARSHDALAEVLARCAPTWLVELPWLLPAGAAGDAVRHRAQGATKARMLREMLQALDALSERAPVLLVLEDLQWADPSTLDLLEALLRRREPARLLLLGTYRTTGDPPVALLARELAVQGRCQTLALERLAPAAVEAGLAARFSGGPLPDGLATTLATRTGGNPLFIRNLVEHWLAEGTMTERDGAVALPRGHDALADGVPPSLRAHIADQLARLPGEDAELLQAASVAGRAFSAGAVAAALDREPGAVAARCAELAATTRLIERRDDGLAFCHDLHREVLYEALGPDVQARLHARVGAHLVDAYGAGATDRAAELSYHFVAGRDPERAIVFLRLAADRAFGRSAYPEGIEHLRAALNAAEGLRAAVERTRWEVELLASLGQAVVATGGWSVQEAEDLLLRARALAAELPDNEPQVSVSLALATLYELRGEFDRANALATESARLAPGDSGEHALETYELLACNLFHQGSFARALEHADQGVARFDGGTASGAYSTFPATLGDNAGVSCHDWAGLALWFLGFPDRALQRASHALELARDPSRAYSLATARAQMAVVHQCRREPEAALEWAEAAIAAAGRLGYAYREAMGRALRGWALSLLGDAEQGVAELTGGLAASRATGAHMDDPYYLGLLAEAQLQAGAHEAGRAAVAEALELAARERSLFYEPELHRLDGALLAADGAFSAAAAALRRGLARARAQGSAALELRIAADLVRNPAASAEGRALLAAAYGRFTEGLGTRDLREAAALLGDQAITPEPASASTSAPSATR